MSQAMIKLLLEDGDLTVAEMLGKRCELIKEMLEGEDDDVTPEVPLRGIAKATMVNVVAFLRLEAEREAEGRPALKINKPLKTADIAQEVNDTAYALSLIHI